MHILFISENFPPETNAAATRVFERARYWVKWGHQVTVLTQAPNFPQGRLHEGYRNRWRQIEDMEGIRVVRVKTFIAANRGTALRTLDFLSFMVTAVLFGLFERKPDVIAATSPQFFSAVAGWVLGFSRQVPFVFELGDLWPASIAAVGAMKNSLALRSMELLELFLYRRSVAIVALTQSFKNDLTRRGIPDGKIAVVINGVDLWRYHPQDRDPDLATEWNLTDKFVVGYVGTHGMAHGLGNILDTAERLHGETGLRFLLAGDGAERESLMAQAQERGLDNVVFMPPQPKERMPAVWSLCDVALVHLRDSPVFAGVIPSKIFEAMGMGLPVLLAAPEGEASQIVMDGGVGVHVPPGEPAALADAVRSLMLDKGATRALAETSLAAAVRHGRDHQARHMIAVLEQVVAGQGSRAAEAMPNSVDQP